MPPASKTHRRRWFRLTSEITLLVVSAAILVVVILLLLNRFAVHPDWDRLAAMHAASKVGMTKSEVAQAIGEPDSVSMTSDQFSTLEELAEHPTTYEAWNYEFDSPSRFQVVFDATGAVKRTGLAVAPPR